MLIYGFKELFLKTYITAVATKPRCASGGEEKESHSCHCASNRYEAVAKHATTLLQIANVHSNYVQPQALNFHVTLFRSNAAACAELHTTQTGGVSSYKYFTWCMEVSIKVTWTQRQYSFKSPCIKD